MDDSLPPIRKPVHMQYIPGNVPVYILDNEDRKLKFVVEVNSIYEKVLKKPAPFPSFVLVSFQSDGKSLFVERCLGHVLNIVDEGTATRCPLNITCIHDESVGSEPRCDLEGVDTPGEDLSVEQVFGRITAHNKLLAEKREVSQAPVKLVFRSSNVQNMRIVDTPGVKVNQDSSSDDRQAIESILLAEMKKPNTKLCVLLQPNRDHATQPILGYLDRTFGSREEWVGKAVFVMTKGDLLMGERKSHGSVNQFFRAYHADGIYPYLVCSPNLEDQSLMQPEHVYEARRELLSSANEFEERKFLKWQAEMRQQAFHTGSSIPLDDEITKRFGFESARGLMRRVLLEDICKRLPEVKRELYHQRDMLIQEQQQQQRMRELESPETLKPIAMKVLRDIEDAVKKYIDTGNYAYTKENRECMQSLFDEIECELSSDWAPKELNNHREGEWRSDVQHLIASNRIPAFIQAEERFMGGKQIERAIELFRLMIEKSIIDSNDRDRNQIMNAVGYLSNGVLAPDWGQAIKQIIECHVEKSAHPGINYVVKHVGSICRRLFQQSFESFKKDSSSDCSLLPRTVNDFIMEKFDDILWEQMRMAANNMNMTLKPMYSYIDPSILGLELIRSRGENSGEINGASRNAVEEAAMSRSVFLQVPKSQFVSNNDVDTILQEALAYHGHLVDLMLVTLRFQMNYHLVIGMKETLRASFDKIILETDWSTMVKRDPELEQKMEKTDEDLRRIKESIRKIQQLL